MKNLLKSYFRTRTFALFVDITLQISEFRILVKKFRIGRPRGFCYATVNLEFRKINRRKPIH